MLLRCVVRCPLLEFDVFLLSSWGLCIWERKITEVKGHIITVLSGVHTVSSVQFSRSVMSDSVTPWTTAHQAPCSSPTLRAYTDSSIESVMLSNHLILCHPLLLHLQSFKKSGSFPVSQLFASGGQSIGVSALASVLPMNIPDWSPLGWIGWIFL